MRQQDIEKFIHEHPITHYSVRIDFVNRSHKIGFFENLVGDYDKLKQKNHWRFIENKNAVNYRKSINPKKNSNDPKYTTIINGDTVNELTIL